MTSGLEFRVTPATPVPAAERAKLIENPGFGKLFTDHMVTIEWTEGKGWHNAEVRPRAPFSLDPAAAVLHYAQEIFEGMKAYRGRGGEITMFRPEENARRFNESADRMAMPRIPEALFVEAVEKLVALDRDWIPSGEGSLYLRPFMFSDEVFLGVRPAAHYIFCVIASPVGPYFKGGGKPVTIWVSDNYTRAAPGGTGAAKCGGNYAGSLIAQAEAIREGCDQVVFLDAAERRWVEELGGMNVFFVMDDGSIITPPLGTILPGITRASLIELASRWRKSLTASMSGRPMRKAAVCAKCSRAAPRLSSPPLARCAIAAANSPSVMARRPAPSRRSCARRSWASSAANQTTSAAGSARSPERMRRGRP